MKTDEIAVKFVQLSLILWILTIRLSAFADGVVKSNPDWLERLSLRRYETASGKKCKSEFGTASSKAPMCPAQTSTTPQNKLTALELEKNAFRNYENQFFNSVRDEQLKQSKCESGYLSIFDQTRQMADLRRCVRSSKDQIEMGLRYAQMGEVPIDKNAVRFQEIVVRDIYRKMKSVCDEEWNIKRDDRQVTHLQREVDQAFQGMGHTRYELEQEALLNTARNQLTKSTDQYLKLQSGIWGGMNPAVRKYVRDSCKTKLNEDEFVKHALDRTKPESFQNHVIDPIRNDNNCRLETLANAGNPLGDNAKRDLVKTGAAFAYINKLNHQDSGLDDFACYMEGVYGSGRDLAYYNIETGVGLVGLALTLPAILGIETTEVVIGSVLVAGTRAGVEMSRQGLCAGGSGLSSVVSSDVCEALPFVRSPTDVVQMVAKDIGTRSTCSGAAMFNAAFIATGAFGLEKFKTLVKGGLFTSEELSVVSPATTTFVNIEQRTAGLLREVKIATAKSAGPTMNTKSLLDLRKQIANSAGQFRSDINQLSDSQLDGIMNDWWKAHAKSGQRIPGLSTRELSSISSFEQIKQECLQGDCGKFARLYSTLNRVNQKNNNILMESNLSTQTAKASATATSNGVFDQQLLQEYAKRHATSMGLTNLQTEDGPFMAVLNAAEQSMQSFGSASH